MELGNFWVELWGKDRFSGAPAYVRDPRVREGICAVLLIDRIAEERDRLIVKEGNHQAEVVRQIEGICQALCSIAAAGESIFFYLSSPLNSVC